MGMSIELNWTDAIGEQLPGAYLLLGQKATRGFQTPVDGVPVSDDLDWSDGQVAVNVSYGTGTYTFPGPTDSPFGYHFNVGKPF